MIRIVFFSVLVNFLMSSIGWAQEIDKYYTSFKEQDTSILFNVDAYELVFRTTKRKFNLGNIETNSQGLYYRFKKDSIGCIDSLNFDEESWSNYRISFENRGSSFAMATSHNDICESFTFVLVYIDENYLVLNLFNTKCKGKRKRISKKIYTETMVLRVR